MDRDVARVADDAALLERGWIRPCEMTDHRFNDALIYVRFEADARAKSKRQAELLARARGKR